MFELKNITSLYKDNNIPEFVKDLHDKIVKGNLPVRSRLAHEVIENLHEEMKSIKPLDLTSDIEEQFFGELGKDIRMEDHPFKAEIIDIIKNFKEDQPLWKTYKSLFPAT